MSRRTHDLCAPEDFEAEAAGKMWKAVSSSTATASSLPGFPKGSKHCLTSVAGLLEEALALVLLRQVSHQIGRSLAQPGAPGVLQRGEARSREEEKPPPWLTLLPGQGCARPALGSAGEGMSPQEARMGGVLVGRRLDREYGDHCGRMMEWSHKKFWSRRALLCPPALPFISCVALDKSLNLSGPQFAHLSNGDNIT